MALPAYRLQLATLVERRPEGRQPGCVIGSLESGDALKAYIKSSDRNRFHVSARGGN